VNLSGGPPEHGRRPPARLDLRRAIHIGASLTAFATALYLPRDAALSVLAAAVVLALVVEVIRRRGEARARFLGIFGRLLKPEEREQVSGATFLAVSYFLAVLLFPRSIALTAMLYGGLGDPAATFAGRRWGTAGPGRKSWQGFAGGFVVNCLVGALMPGIGPALAPVGALAASLAEMLPVPLDDNLRTTLSGGAALWAVAAIF
jgi:dolichol kinase